MRLVCVTGMHRSGTSVLARLANLLGVDLGDHDAMLPQADDNPRGYWENAAISSLNEWVLQRMGGSWDDPPRLVPNWEHSPQLDEIRVHAAETIVTALHSSSGIAGFKDPRTSLTLPFWRTVTPVAATVMALRQPAEVARSLRDRNGIEADRAAFLWVRYVAAAFLADPDRLIVPFDDLIADLPAAAEAIAAHLGLDPPGADRLAEMAEFVEPGLRHHVGAPAPAGPHMELAMVLYELLAAPESRSQVGPVLRSLQDAWTEADRVGEELDQVNRLAAVLADTQEKALEFDEKLRHSLLERSEAAEQHAARFQSELVVAGELTASLRQRAESAEHRIEQLQVELAATHEAATAALQRAEAAEDRSAQLERERAEIEQANAAAEQAHAATHAMIVAAREEAIAAARRAHAAEQEAVAAHEELRSRRSVRAALRISDLARPVFSVLRRLRRRRASG